MKIAVLIARYLLGLIFVVFGLNGFFQFLPPPEMSGDAGTFIGILVSSNILTVVKVLEVAGGALLLLGRVPAGAFLLGPVVVNILLFHTLLEPSGLIMALVVTLLETILVVAHWDRFKGIFV